MLGQQPSPAEGHPGGAAGRGRTRAWRRWSRRSRRRAARPCRPGAARSSGPPRPGHRPGAPRSPRSSPSRWRSPGRGPRARADLLLLGAREVAARRPGSRWRSLRSSERSPAMLLASRRSMARYLRHNDAVTPSFSASEPLVLGIETSCDETGVGIVQRQTLLAGRLVGRGARAFGGVVRGRLARPPRGRRCRPSSEHARMPGTAADAIAVTARSRRSHRRRAG